MSADDAILMVRLDIGGKYVWVVLHVQAIENVLRPFWLEFYLTNQKTVKYTTQRSTAIRIARQRANRLKVEHGLVEMDSTVQLSEDRIQMNQGTIHFNYEVSYDSPRLHTHKSETVVNLKKIY
jgi:hypothetical protein